MGKDMTYEEQLQDPRWLRVRRDILDRDKECRYCNTKQDLQVHHMEYRSGLMAWEYPYSVLLTLCRRCHEGQHRLGFASGSSLRQTRSLREVMLETINGMMDGV